MIAKVGRRHGSKTLGLLSYLYGPGANQEHSSPHLVASWDGQEPDPAAGPEEGLLERLAVLSNRLDEPVLIHQGRLGRHVWHCSVRTAPEDRQLSDAEWADVAREIVDAAGIAPKGDLQACRWVAVRHAADHIHIAATLRRLDGKRPRQGNDYLRLRRACNRLERRYGLKSTAPADRTAGRRPSRSELGKAERLNLARPAREELAGRVRLVAATAVSENDFFSRLRQAGVAVNVRRVEGRGVVGYSVALPGDVNRQGRPVWFSGSKLAPDLSLPRVRERWVRNARALLETERADRLELPGGSPVLDRMRERVTFVQRAQRAAGTSSEDGPRVWAMREATQALARAAEVFFQGSDEERAAVVCAVGDLLTVAAARSPDGVRARVGAAAREFERAARVPLLRAQNTASKGLARAAWILHRAGRAAPLGRETAAIEGMLGAAADALQVTVRWYVTRRFHSQWAAARKTLGHLRAAVQQTGPVRSAPSRRLAARRRTPQAIGGTGRGVSASGLATSPLIGFAGAAGVDPAALNPGALQQPRGRRLPQGGRDRPPSQGVAARYEAALRKALARANHALRFEQVVEDPGWDVLVGILRSAERRGHSAEKLLVRAMRQPHGLVESLTPVTVLQQRVERVLLGAELGGTQRGGRTAAPARRTERSPQRRLSDGTSRHEPSRRPRR